MNPLKFKEATVELKKPSNMSDEDCGSLYVCQTEKGECISVWTTSFWERLKFLFHGKIWIGILSGDTQPAIWLDCTNTVFTSAPPNTPEEKCLEKCESCEKETDFDTMEEDADANYFCPECWEELEPVMRAEYDFAVERGEIETED